MTEQDFFPLRTINILNADWKIISYDFYCEYIENEIKLQTYCKSLFDLIDYSEAHSFRSPFRWELEIGSLYFVAAVFPEEKLIRIGSKQLGMELELLSLESEISKISALGLHAKEIAQISAFETPTQIEYLSHINKLPLFNEDKYEDVLNDTEAISEELISKVNEYKQSFFEKITDFSLDLTANFMLVRIHLLKFLAILPCLDHDKDGVEVKRILIESISRLIKDSKKALECKLKGQRRPLPKLYMQTAHIALFCIKIIPAKILAWLVRFAVSFMAKRFIAGENIQKAKTSLQELLTSSRDATIDQLGELVVSSSEAQDYTNKVLEIIEGLGEHIPKGSRNSAGILKAHVSIKVTALTHNFTSNDLDYAYSIIAPRLKKILLSGAKNDVFVNIDAEHYHYRDAVLVIYRRVLLSTPELVSYGDTGIVIQGYLRDAFNHFEDVLSLAKERGLNMPIRLVKGAYWDAETIEAQAHNYPAEQFLNKEETDIHFRQLIDKILHEGAHLQLTIASHNIQDHCFSQALRRSLYSNAPEIEHQCLHMTYEALSVGLSKMGWPTRNYIPVGNLLVGMAYLVRRIMENSSQVGVLTMMRSHKKALNFKGPTKLLKERKANFDLVYDDGQNVLIKDFKNIYPLRTYLPSHLDRIQSHLNADLEKLERGVLYNDFGEISISCSSKPELTLGKISFDTVEEVDLKVEKLFESFMDRKWSHDDLLRNEVLFRLSEELLMNRERLCSLIMFEAGKTIDEAVADVDEAIDFINFYVREQNKITATDIYEARGVVGVIAPWNFPLAIPCGMSVAALCAGNTVVLKPAEQTPLIGLEFHRLAMKAGIPENVFQIVLGEGDIGARVVDNEVVSGVVFTGSKVVGETIYKKISQMRTSERYHQRATSKFAITEMGGKNAIIVTNNCELDETVSGILYASFAHAGQKCSASSRIIIDSKIKEAFKLRFEKAVADLKVGSALDASTFINPLASLEDQKRVKAMAMKAAEEVEQYNGSVIIDLSSEVYSGYCVGPSVFELDAQTVLKYETVASQEVFGPVIHLIPYEDLDEAIKIFNSTQYALTGGIYCQSQNDIDYLVPRMQSGNIYINRPNTGARVAIEPFGGYKMSGTGPKAGGVDYLFKFNQKKVHQAEKHKNVFQVEDSIKSYVAQFSSLSEARRLKNAKGLIKTLIFQYTELFGSINEENKGILDELLFSLEAGQFNLSTREFPNRSIPGQISYSKKDVALGNGCMVDSGVEINFQLISDFLVNLIIGNGITILATNEEIYNKWMMLVVIAYKHGFSDLNVTVSLMNKEALKVFIKETPAHFYCFDSLDVTLDIQETIFSRNYEGHLIKVIFCDNQTSIDQIISSYTHTRSFAINTMRHGAPLSMDF